MDQARKEADAGNLDAAIHTALRAKKIAEASTATLGASPDCSPAAADQLYRELAARRPRVAPPLATPVAEIAEPVPPPRSPIVVAPNRRTSPAQGENWQAHATNENVAVSAEPSPVMLDPQPSKPVVLKRSPRPIAPVTPELDLPSPLDIVGGNRKSTRQERPKFEIPLDEPGVVTALEIVESDLPKWALESHEEPPAPLAALESHEKAAPVLPRSETTVVLRPISSAPREITTEPVVTTASPPISPPAVPVQRVEAASTVTYDPGSMWSGVGAVVAPRQRLARVATLRTDGWESPADTQPTVTRAGGVLAEKSDNASATVSPTGYRGGQESLSDGADLLEKPSAGNAAPPPPSDIDEADVSLHSPSVWIRDTTPVLAPTPEPQAAVPATLWQTFSKWSQQRGWTASSAAMGLTAAVLAFAACVVAIFPRSKTRV